MQGDWSASLAWADAELVLGTLLGLGVGRSTVSLQKLGFFVVHNGMLLVLIGGATSKLFTVRGILHLFLGDGPKEVFWAYHDPEDKRALPFGVQLQHFARMDWKELEVYFIDAERELTSRPPSYTLWPGRVIDLDYQEGEDGEMRPRVRVIAKELYDRAEPGTPVVTERDGGEVLPLAELTINDAHLWERDHQHEAGPNHSHDRRELLFSRTIDPRVYVDPLGGFRLAAGCGAEPSDLLELFPEGLDILGTVRIEVDSEPGAARTELLRRGKTLSAPGGYTIELLDVTHDLDTDRDRPLSNHPLPLEDQPFRLRAVWVQITKDGADTPPETRVLIEGLDYRETGNQPNFDYPDVYLNYRGDDWAAPGPPRFLLTWDADNDQPMLLGEDGTEFESPWGSTLELPAETETRVRLDKTYVHSDFVANPTFLSPLEGVDGWDQDFYSLTPRGAYLEVIQDPDTPQAVSHEIRLASTQAGRSDVWLDPVGFEDENGDLLPRFALRFLEDSQKLPFEWRSVLRFFERDASGNAYEVDLGNERAREIRVNDYLTYKGYRFFQTNAIAERPDYSGIGVVYDPGIEPVLAGMYTVIAGTSIAFLVRPIVRRRKTEPVPDQSAEASAKPSEPIPLEKVENLAS